MVLRIIKKNYRLLMALTEGEYTILQDRLPALLRQGFNPNYFTSMLNINHQSYRFCFDWVFLIGEDRIILLTREQQLQLPNQGFSFTEE